MFSLRLGGGGFGWLPRRPDGRPARRGRAGAAAGDGGVGGQTYAQRVAGVKGPLNSGAISGALAGAGDLLAQIVGGKQAEARGEVAPEYDLARTLRMVGFGLLWYGPYQYYWYNLMDWAMPARTTSNFISKVALNQLALAPAVLAVVFAWNLALTGQASQIPDKIQRDLVPSMLDGWKFWVPAASINFYCVPLDKQVLYMSACGMLWTAYLSYASAKGAVPQQARKVQALPATKGAPAAPKACCAAAASSGAAAKGGGGRKGLRDIRLKEWLKWGGIAGWLAAYIFHADRDDAPAPA